MSGAPWVFVRRGPAHRPLALGLLVALALPSVGARAQDARPAASASVTTDVWARVTYRSGATIYLDAGSRAGLAEGSRGTVMRGGVAVTTLTVTAVSSTRAASTAANAVDSVAIGDSALFVVTVTAVTPASSGASAGRATPASRRSERPLRGRVGLRYLTMDQGTAAARLARPALDLRLDGQRLGSTPFGLALDVRASRTRLTHRPDGSAAAPPPGSTLVYQAALLLERADTPARLSVGRQYSTALPAIGLFDGVAADVDSRHVGAGLFAGSQPDVTTFGYSNDIREYGAYVKVHAAPAAGGLWSFTTGAVGSYAAGEVNREFLYLQGMFVSRRLSLFTTQEIDYNRGWKTDAGEPTTSLTATYAQARLAVSDALSVSAGMDSRRNVRLYRDYVDPEIEFDDALRQGIWAGASLALWNHVLASYDARRGTGAGDMDSRTGSVNVTRLTRLGLGVRGRFTTYANAVTSGHLRTASLEMHPASAARVELSVGRRDDRRVAAASPESGATWFGFGADVSLGRSLFLTYSAYRERTSAGTSMQHLGALTYRF